MKKIIKESLNLILRFGLSFGLLWFLFSKNKADIPKMTEAIRSADWFYLAMAMLVFLIIHVLILIRWIIFMRAMNLRFRTLTVARYLFIGLFGNLFLPTGIGGDIIKAIGLARETKNKPKVVASIVLDRLSGFASIVIVATISYIFGFRYIHSVTLGILIGVIGIVSVFIAFLLFNSKIYHFGCQLFSRFPKFQKALISMHEDISMLKDRKWHGFGAIALSCVSQLIFAATYFYTAKALHMDVPILYCWIVVPLICVTSSFPSIGGIGVREAGAESLFLLLGAPAGTGKMLGLLNSFFMIIIGLAGGLVLLFTGFKLSEAVNEKAIQDETTI